MRSSTRPIASRKRSRFFGPVGFVGASVRPASAIFVSSRRRFSAFAAAFASLDAFFTSSCSTRLARKSATFCRAWAKEVPVKISRPMAARPASITNAPYGDRTLDSGFAAIAPNSPPASPSPPIRFVSSTGANRPGLPRASDTMPSTPNASRTKPMSIRTRSSGETSRRSTNPQ